MEPSTGRRRRAASDSGLGVDCTLPRVSRGLSRVRTSLHDALRRDTRLELLHPVELTKLSNQQATCSSEPIAPTPTGALQQSPAQIAAPRPSRPSIVGSAGLCRDLRGHWHDTQELRDRRNAAVMKGMRWLHKFLTSNKNEALVAIGDDGACIFFEIWYTSCSSTIRGAARGIAQELLEKYEQHLLEPALCKCKACSKKLRKECSPVDLFMQLMYLIRCKDEMEIDARAMLERADELWKAHGLSNTNKLFGLSAEELPEVTEDAWVVLIMNLMIMEFNQLLFPRRWPISWGLREAFIYLRTHHYTGPPYDVGYRFHDSFYLVTHIAFAVTAYSAIKSNPKDVPWLFDYNRRSAHYWVKQAWRRLSGRQPDRLVDIDGLSEAIDVMRGCGLTDGGDALLCSSTLAVLALQRPDGSWPFWKLKDDDGDRLVAEAPVESSFYNRIHPTWVAVQSLRDRSFEYERKGNKLWAQHMSRLLKQTNLRKLETKIVYKRPARKSQRRQTPCSEQDGGSEDVASAALVSDLGRTSPSLESVFAGSPSPESESDLDDADEVAS